MRIGYWMGILEGVVEWVIKLIYKEYSMKGEFVTGEYECYLFFLIIL